MSRLKTFLSLPPGDQLRLVVAAAVLLATWVGVTVVPFERFRAGLLRVAGICRHVLPGTPSTIRLAQTVDIADSNLPGDRTCLVRSLTTELLLESYEHSFVHRIGVDRSEDGEFEAHSWIEYDGEILIGNLEDIDRYQPLPPLNGGENV